MLSGVYRAPAAGKDSPGFLRRAALLHGRRYSHGAMDVDLADDGRSCSITLDGAPTDSKSDPYVAAGFYAGAAGLPGIQALEWELSWDSPAPASS